MRRIGRTASESGGDRRRPSLTRRTAVLGLVLMVAALATVVTIALAAVPTFPDNILVFPNRDFVTIEGYQDHIGETATVEVTRDGNVIGSAEGIVHAGDVALEINHPGGYCWGAGTNLNVTPDIRPGDTVTIKFAGTAVGDTTVQDAFVDTNSVLSGTTLTIEGHIAAGVNTDQLEQRIVNPDLTALVGRRDVRAIPGPLTPAPKGGYSSSLVVNGTRFTATYEFDSADTAAVAAGGGGERLLSWQETDADGNRQGVTIAEFGEQGGPGMGGCPLSPGDQGAPRPGTAAVVRSDDKTQIQVSWAPAAAVPGAAAVTGYSVEAIAQTTSPSGEQVQVGRRTSETASRTTIDGLDPNESYRVEVRSLAGPRMSDAFTVEVPTANPAGDLTPPTVDISPALAADGPTEASSVTLSTEPNADIYFTTDGSPALDNGDLPSDSAKLYTGSIPITAETTIRFVAIDRAGNFTQGSGTFVPPPVVVIPPPDAPTLGDSTAGQGSVTLKWNATDPSITGYGVQLYDDTFGTTVGDIRETAAKTLTISGLNAGTPYSFTVKAKNESGYGPPSARSGPLTPTDRVTITSAKWKAGDFRVSGTGSVNGAIVTIRSGSPTGTSLGSAAVAVGVFDLRARNGAAPATRPATIYAVSNQGGVAGPFVVTNG